MVHVVVRGETLRRIAEAHGSTVAAFIEANPNIDPDRIFPGQELELPSDDPSGDEPEDNGADRDARSAVTAPETAAGYTVASGDTMSRIASSLGFTLGELLAANPQITNPNVIHVGQELNMPSSEPAGVDSAGIAGDAADLDRDEVDAGEVDAGGVDAGEVEVGDRRDWADVPVEKRMLHVMDLLVGNGYAVNGAAGIVGNLFVESGVLPNRLERSAPETPMRSKAFNGDTVIFTAAEVMNRNEDLGVGPLLAGVGLAQWTWFTRRDAMFAHEYKGRVLGADILFDMDAQVDYLVRELTRSYTDVDKVVRDPHVTVDRASDEVLYSYETPGSVKGPSGKLPKSDPAVQRVFGERRVHGHRARAVYRSAHGV